MRARSRDDRVHMRGMKEAGLSGRLLVVEDEQAVSDETVDLVLTDLGMLGGDGTVLLEQAADTLADLITEAVGLSLNRSAGAQAHGAAHGLHDRAHRPGRDILDVHLRQREHQRLLAGADTARRDWAESAPRGRGESGARAGPLAS